MVLFPLEIWQMIFHQVDSSIDLLQLSLVCKDWYRIIRYDPRLTKHLKLKQKLTRPRQHQFLRAFQHLKILELHGNDFSLAISKTISVQPLLARLEQVIVHDYSTSKARKHLTFAGKRIRQWYLLFDRITLNPKNTSNLVFFHLDQVLGFNIPAKNGEKRTKDLTRMANDLVNLTHLSIADPFSKTNSRLMDCFISKCGTLTNLELFGSNFDAQDMPPLLRSPYHGVKTLNVKGCSWNGLKEQIDGLVENFPKVTKLIIVMSRYDLCYNSDRDDKMLTLLEILSSTSLSLTYLELCLFMSPWKEHWLLICQVVKQRINEYFSERVFVKITFDLTKFKVLVVKNPYQEANFYLLKDNKKYFGKSIAFKDPTNFTAST